MGQRVQEIEFGTYMEEVVLSRARDIAENGHNCETAATLAPPSDEGASEAATATLKQPETEEPDAQTADNDSKNLKKVAFAATVGNVLEWYDFGVFAFLAPQIGDQFFPEGDRATAILNAFIVFGGAFVIRPLGGALFGHIGDRYGRKAALQISVAMMGISTFIIGCLPTYAQIGALAPLFLTVCRLFQGLSVGGEFVGSLIYAVESAPAERKVLFGSLCTASAVGGTTLGSWTGLLLHAALTDQELLEFGWRIPFWCGLVIGAFALWMRKGLGESEEFAQDKAAASSESSPLVEGLRRQPVSILLAFCIAAIYGFGVWFISTFPPVLYLDLMDPPLGVGGAGRRGGDAVYHGGSEIWLLHTLILCVVVAAIPVWGWVGDKLGNRRVMAAATMAVAVAAVPCSSGMGSGVVWLALGAQAALGVGISCIGANFPSYLVQVFPVKVRYSCLAVGYNGALGLFGGTAGIVGTYIFKSFGSTTWIGGYMSAVACMSCAGVLVQNARYRRDAAREAALPERADDARAPPPVVVVDMREGGRGGGGGGEVKVVELEAAVAALQAEREETRARQAELAAENGALRRRLSALEARVLGGEGEGQSASAGPRAGTAGGQ